MGAKEVTFTKLAKLEIASAISVYSITTSGLYSSTLSYPTKITQFNSIANMANPTNTNIIPKINNLALAKLSINANVITNKSPIANPHKPSSVVTLNHLGFYDSQYPLPLINQKEVITN